MAHSKCHQDMGRDLISRGQFCPALQHSPWGKDKTAGTLAESHAERTKAGITGLQRARLSVREKGEGRRGGQPAR